MKSSIVIALMLAAPLGAMAQTTVFSDNFANGSTLNGTSTPGGTPTASSTSYDIGANKAATTLPAITSGDLKLGLNGATGSGAWEAQALFTATPITLATVGDSINITYSFTDTGGGLLAGGTGSYLYTGLYNSGGNAPVAGGLNNSGFNGTDHLTGNAAGWLGYVGLISNGGTSKLLTRAAQTGVVNNNNQSLLASYNSPSGSALGSQTSTVALTADSQYTISYTIALTAAGTLTIYDNLYSGVGTGGTSVFSQTSIAVTGANLLATTFDGLAIGARNGGTSFNPVEDVSQITITSDIQAVPEPTTLALLGGGAVLGLVFRRRSSRN